jgi:hypothetical protein
MECVICYEVLGTAGQVTTECGHNYCVKCFSTHVRKTSRCAYCRTEMCDPPEPTITEDQLLKILENCLEVSALCEEVKNDIVEQFNMEILNYRGVCDIRTANKILERLNYSYTVAIISHKILEIISDEF